jgi:hypothetical protein
VLSAFRQQQPLMFFQVFSFRSGISQPCFKKAKIVIDISGSCSKEKDRNARLNKAFVLCHGLLAHT